MNQHIQKKTRRVSFSAAHHQAHTREEILNLLLQTFQSHQINITQEFTTNCTGETDPNDSGTTKSFKSLRKEVNQALSILQKLLARELSDSLKVILKETFQDESGYTDIELGVNALMIFYGLLKTTNINDENSNKLLRWIYDLSRMSSLPLCMQLSNVISSIKKKLIKLGFTILNKFMNVSSDEIGEELNEQHFKTLVSRLIKEKEKQVNDIPFQMCRVCESFQPLNSMAAHLKQCERRHQIKYNQTKLQQKGVQLLNSLAKLNPFSEQGLKEKKFFYRIFQSFNGRNVNFKLKHQKEQINDVIIQYQMKNLQKFRSVIDLLKKYNNLTNQYECLQTLSDHQSKPIIKSRRYVSIRGLQSTTSLQPQSQQTMHLSHSQKTINSDTQSHSRCSGCRLSDFQVIKKIGKGSYSQVYLVRKRNTRDLFAMKVIEFQDLNQERMQAFKKEQKIYKSIAGDFNVKLYYSFREQNLYFFILDYAAGGNFRTLLQNEVYIEQKYSKVYLANLILAVNSIHSMGIVHRDLKPDNIVIAQDGHLILTDFNLSKLIKEQQQCKPNTFFGTPDYIAPQVLNGQPTSQVIDWFSVGVIAYQMIIGVTPFTDYSERAVFDNILSGKIEWPEVGTGQDQITQQCKDFIQKMLNPNPQTRLGSTGIAQIKVHPFFQGINWDKILQSQFFFIPQKEKNCSQNLQLLEYIKNKKKKVSIQFISSQESVVRYDILKQATNLKARSHRNSRFKLQKELEALKLLPSTQGIKVKKQYSYNNFNALPEDNKGQSCRDFSEDIIKCQDIQ